MIIQQLALLFEKWAGEKAFGIDLLPASGSYRKYYRMTGTEKTCLGVYNSDKKENEAFKSFTRHFLVHNCKVPQIFAEDIENDIYLIEDLGDETLFNRLQSLKTSVNNDDEIIKLYKKVIDELPKFQLIAAKDMDFSNCYPRTEFDKQSMLWDLNYFKYYFLKLAQISFDEQQLEEDFHIFSDFLLEADRHYFLYRDFQSRNIMLFHEMPYFIDYQGGRKGALQYDIASLLYDAKADLSNDAREILLSYYIEQLKQYIQIDNTKFAAYYYGFVLIRIMQAMGAYGFRGFYENKPVFLQSIPYALKNLNWVLKNAELPINIPTLIGILSKLSEATKIKKIVNTQNLKIAVHSFSYKQHIPIDNTANGGGYVFDCRALPNPGRLEIFKTQTGKDKAVINFLESETVVSKFLDNVFATVCISIDNYIERGFENLMINFGCTGGQHRSVYCAEKIAAMIKEKYNISCIIHHTVQEFGLKNN
jgi:aminoglycoside/choline kinase family phosphotransferase